MQPTICSRCHKNMAVIFITKVENGETKNEGLCLKCARELHIKPVDDVINRMGLSDEDLDSLSSEMMDALGGPEALSDTGDGADDEDEGKTATFPFLNRLFGGGSGPNLPARQAPCRRATPPPSPARSSRPRARRSAASASSWTPTASTSRTARARASWTP